MFGAHVGLCFSTLTPVPVVTVWRGHRTRTGQGREGRRWKAR